MKSFARNRKNKRTDGIDPDTAEGLIDVDELDIAPLGVAPGTRSIPGSDDPNADEAADFAERLGDLDRFIGGGTAPATGPTTSVSWTGGAPARNLPAAPIPAVAPISHPRPASFDRAAELEPQSGAVERPVADPEAEAQEFVDRLGDLDRFIGGNGSAPTPAATATPEIPAAEPEAEAQDFLDRLGDLDRFIGGNGSGGNDADEQRPHRD